VILVSVPLALRMPHRHRACPLPANTRQVDHARPVRHPLCSRLYAQQVERAEELGLSERRRELLAGVSGRVLEIGAGTGVNLRHYPSTVEELVLVEPEPYLRRRLTLAAAESSLRVTVIDASAERLPLDAASIDAAVSCLVLCSVRDVNATLRELRRILTPDGEFRFMEHVASERPPRRRAQRIADASLWPLVSGGCHLGRDTLGAMETAGFHVDRVEKFDFRIPPLDPPKTHVCGVAHIRR
jgi:SAM-dependent methyltransferase